METKELVDFLEDYFKVLQNQDLELFDRVFHPSSILYSQQDGFTVIRPLEVYKEIIKNRASPQSGGYPEKNEIIMIDFLSSTMALVKVRLLLFNNVMEDYLNVMKTDVGWQIFSKHFHRAEILE